MRRQQLERRIEALNAGTVRVEVLRDDGFHDVTAERLVELYRELGEVGGLIHAALAALRARGG